MKSKRDKKDRLVVYTALFGDYDVLIDPPEEFEGCDFVCFTDQKCLKSDIWRIRLVENCDLSSNMMNRRYKLLPHLYFPEYERSLYIDTNVRLFSSPFELATCYLDDNLIAAPVHPLRDCIYQEAIICIELDKAPMDIVESQMESYRSKGYPANNGLFEMNVILRRHSSEKVISLMSDWWAELQKWSKRDQLSFCYVVWKNEIKVLRISETARNVNKYFFLECHKDYSTFRKIKRYFKRYLFKFFALWN